MIATDWSATTLGDVRLTGATGQRLAEARAAVLDWARADGGGTPQVIQDLVGGQIDLLFDQVASSLQQCATAQSRPTR